MPKKREKKVWGDIQLIYVKDRQGVSIDWYELSESVGIYQEIGDTNWSNSSIACRIPI